jgi:hypothetical protein
MTMKKKLCKIFYDTPPGYVYLLFVALGSTQGQCC